MHGSRHVCGRRRAARRPREAFGFHRANAATRRDRGRPGTTVAQRPDTVRCIIVYLTYRT